ncbi:MAG: PHP domain-containing protein, partial [Opitutae bacterium]|nr:PHP domain-containing protein [Opitutae bacterium]
MFEKSNNTMRPANVKECKGWTGCALRPLTSPCPGSTVWPPMNPLPADYHTHTHLCRHAGGTPIDYARAAAERGIPEIACTDHIPFPDDPNPSIRMPRADFPSYLAMVREAQNAGYCRVLLGIEADYQRDLVGGHIQSVLDLADFDIVLGSLHT